MNIRPMKTDDLPAIKDIHLKYFKDEFEFPEFTDKFLCSFIVEDDNKEIICGGGVRTIAESIMITNQDITAREKMDSLLLALLMSTYMTSNYNFTQLHAFAQDDIWQNILRKVGFRDCKGKALVIGCR